MDKYKIKLVVVHSGCDCYKLGDEIVFDGPLIDKGESDNLCMMALQAVFPYVYAARKGVLWESPLQCPDCDEKVEFKLIVIE